MWYPRAKSQTQTVVFGTAFNIPASGSAALLVGQGVRTVAPGAVQAWLKVQIDPASAGRIWRVRVFPSEQAAGPTTPAGIIEYEKPIAAASPFGTLAWIPLNNGPVPNFVTVVAHTDASGAVVGLAEVVVRQE
jgi:hypothetical protein